MRSKRSRKGLFNVVQIGDTHVGCGMSLMSPSGAYNDTNQIIQPSPVQVKLHRKWEEFWGEWVPQVTHGEPYAVVHIGDSIDGVHHGATHQWTHNMECQAEHAYQLLKPVVDGCEGRYYHIRGTEAHVGKSGENEERLAKRLGAIPGEEGQYARWELWLRVQGQLCHFLHHIGTTGSAQHELSALNGEMAAIYNDCARWNREPPVIIGRGHRHRCAEGRFPSSRGYCTVFTSPAWQLKTPFAWKIPGARVQTPQVGGSLIRLGDEELHTRHKVWEIERTKEEVLRSVSKAEIPQGLVDEV